MDILGKESEKQIKQIDSRLDEVESHLEAVDSALQDFLDEYDVFIRDELEFQEKELNKLREVVDEQVESENTKKQLEDRIDSLEEQLTGFGEEVEEKLQSFVETMKRIDDSIEANTERISEVEQSINEDVEDRIDELENRFMVHRNNSEYDFEKKLDRREFKEAKQDINERISRLRAAIHFLADELGKEDKVEIE